MARGELRRSHEAKAKEIRPGAGEIEEEDQERVVVMVPKMRTMEIQENS